MKSAIGVGVINGVTPDGPPVVLNHDPAVAISGRARLPEDRHEDYYVVARAKGITYEAEVSRGQFGIGYLAPGRYELLLTNEEGKVLARLPSVRAGSEEITLVAEGAAPEDD